MKRRGRVGGCTVLRVPVEYTVLGVHIDVHYRILTRLIGVGWT